jgi:hypothetical protein
MMFLKELISNNVWPILVSYAFSGKEKEFMHIYYDQFTYTQLELIEKVKYVYISTTGS